MKKKARSSKKKAPARTQQHSKEPAREQALVYVTGDVPLVREYALLCARHGFAVAFGSNQDIDPLSAELHGIGKKTTVIPRGASVALELTNVDLAQKRKNLEALDRVLPETVALITSSVTVSATEQSSWIRHQRRLVGCGALPAFAESPLIEIAPTVFSSLGTVEVVQKFFRSIGKEIEIVQDRVGLVFPRIFCQLVNEAVFALQDEVAAPEDLDRAMKAAARYPIGPIEWADRIGLEHVYAVQSALFRDIGGDRYRVAPLLKQLALSGTWWPRNIAPSEERQ